MGRSLAVAIEYYDGNGWITLNSDLDGPFVQEEVLPGLIEKSRRNFLDNIITEDEIEDYTDDIEGEAYGELTDYFTHYIEQNYDLFDLIATAGNDDGSRATLSGFRGDPLDTSVPYKLFGYPSVSFITLGEIRTIDWKQRVDVVRSIPFSKYVKNSILDDKRANVRGKRLEVTEK